MEENIKITVIIPCYNEAKTIEKVLIDVKKNLDEINYSYEIIIINDFSSDNTENILKKLKVNENLKIINHDKNMGKGAAVRSGISVSKGELIIIQDADLEYNPRDYKKLLIPFEETDADVVYGSRFIGGGNYVRIHFFWHFLANKILTFICNFFTNLNLTDMETGYKVFKRNILLKLDLKENSFGIEPELTIKLSKKNAKFFEVPISYNGRSYAEGKKITIKDAFRALFCIFRYSIFK
ncbi:glycosyltransferase family 2 protein [Candidatus Pelagibacter sp.]|uniref:glycosyltransferase family 2 protein n=1 Tax=Candidatus Pelagibacter sp. TaxID=2024849 RepID=UPI003F849C9E